MSNKKILKKTSFKIHTPCFSERTHLCKTRPQNIPTSSKWQHFKNLKFFQEKQFFFFFFYRDCPWNYSINHMLKRRKTNQKHDSRGGQWMSLTPQYKFIQDPPNNQKFLYWIISNDASVGMVLEQACRLQSESRKCWINSSNLSPEKFRSFN
jgi:hypothetical protein